MQAFKETEEKTMLASKPSIVVLALGLWLRVARKSSKAQLRAITPCVHGDRMHGLLHDACLVLSIK
ncbi:MAG: hypothetical protein DUD39_12410 [Coriobacteriaceae bacterium]|jgi:hypothetical protein|nr:MAG: hypothetical protein DUD39_12410 [Coriobacteriaceae bacterium]